MASNNVYEIHIIYDQNAQAAGDSPIAGSGSVPPSAPSSGEGSAPAISPTAGALKVARPFVDTALSMRSQYISTVTGSQQLAQRNQLTNAAVRGGLDLAAGAAAGGGIASALGMSAMAGPAAIIGAAMAAIGKVLEIAQNAAEIANKMEVENTAISAGRARAGISWNMSRRK